MSVHKQMTARQAHELSKIINVLMSRRPTRSRPMPALQLAAKASVPVGHISDVFAWLQREVATGVWSGGPVYFGSVPGPGGGYYVSLDTDEIRGTTLREMQTGFNTSLRRLGQANKALAVVGDPEDQEVVAAIQSQLRSIRRALRSLGADPGNITR